MSSPVKRYPVHIAGAPLQTWLFASIPIVVSLVGCAVSHSAGISATVFAPNFAGVLLGALLILNSKNLIRLLRANTTAAAFFTLAFLTATLFFSGYEGVRRWIPLGPLQLNVSMAVIPIGLYLMTIKDDLPSLLFGILISTIFYLQPDAGQATAFMVGAAILLLSSKPLKPVILLFIGILGFTAMTWFRNDPLPAVDHVKKSFTCHCSRAQCIL